MVAASAHLNQKPPPALDSAFFLAAMGARSVLSSSRVQRRAEGAAWLKIRV